MNMMDSLIGQPGMFGSVLGYPYSGRPWPVAEMFQYRGPAPEREPDRLDRLKSVSPAAKRAYRRRKKMTARQAYDALGQRYLTRSEVELMAQREYIARTVAADPRKTLKSMAETRMWEMHIAEQERRRRAQPWQVRIWRAIQGAFG